VELQRTLVTNVPGVAFGVKADAFSMEDDSPIKGMAASCTSNSAAVACDLWPCQLPSGGVLAVPAHTAVIPAQHILGLLGATSLHSSKHAVV
jgi:hypothetical protein